MIGKIVRRVLLGLFAAFCAAILVVLVILGISMKREDEERRAVRSVIQEIVGDFAYYQPAIQQWDVTAALYSVPGEEPEDWLGKRYVWGKIREPVLVLTGEESGSWCFYTGFDQYVEEKVVETEDGEEKTVTLVIKKRNIDKPPRWENTETDSESSAYYDVEVMVIVAPGEESWEKESWYHTYYSSSDFNECKYFFGDAWVDMDKKNRYNDRHIKEWYSPEQLFDFYRKGLELGEQLRQLSLGEE